MPARQDTKTRVCVLCVPTCLRAHMYMHVLCGGAWVHVHAPVFEHVCTCTRVLCVVAQVCVCVLVCACLYACGRVGPPCVVDGPHVCWAVTARHFLGTGTTGFHRLHLTKPPGQQHAPFTDRRAAAHPDGRAPTLLMHLSPEGLPMGPQNCHRALSKVVLFNPLAETRTSHAVPVCVP